MDPLNQFEVQLPKPSPAGRSQTEHETSEDQSWFEVFLIKWIPERVSGSCRIVTVQTAAISPAGLFWCLQGSSEESVRASGKCFISTVLL